MNTQPIPNLLGELTMRCLRCQAHFAHSQCANAHTAIVTQDDNLQRIVFESIEERLLFDQCQICNKYFKK
jgi:hypothetical protein